MENIKYLMVIALIYFSDTTVFAYYKVNVWYICCQEFCDIEDKVIASIQAQASICHSFQTQDHDLGPVSI